MKRKTSVCAGFLVALTPFLLGQEPQNQTPRFPEDLIATSQPLVEWSWMQKPQPAPQPLPPPDKSLPQPEPQTPAHPSTPQDQQQTQAQTFTGKIVKDGDKYVLKVASNTSYQLDEQSNAKAFENKDVKIVGTLDKGTNTIRIDRIELLS